MKKITYTSILFVSLACIFGGTARAQIPIDQWGKTDRGKAWPIKNDSTTLTGDAGIGNGAIPTGWSTIRGGFDPVTITTDTAIIVSGKMEFIGSGGASAYTWLRYALTYQDSCTLHYRGTDSAEWISSQKHYGYEFCPKSGIGVISKFENSVLTVVNGNWLSAWSNGGKGVLATVKQAPRNAVAIAGTYNFAISVRSVNDTLNEVRWYLVEQNNKYWWAGSFIDTATTKKFNGICFGFNNDLEATQVNFYGVKVDMGAPIIIPEPPFEPFYIDQWGKTDRGKSWPILWNDSTTFIGDASIGNGTRPIGWATIRGGFDPVTITTDKGIIVSGKMELVGGGGDSAYTHLRYALTYQDSSYLNYRGTDSAEWDSPLKHYGYAFMPQTGTGTMANGAGGSGTVWTVVNGNWNSTLSNGGKGPLSTVKQSPRNAVMVAGTYNWAISVRSVNDTVNEIKWYLVEQNNKYWYGGTVIDVATTKIFNGVNFGFNDDIKATQVNFKEVKVELGNIGITPPDYYGYYIGQWGMIGNRFGGWKFIPDSNGLIGNAGIGGNTPNTSWAEIRGGFEEYIQSVVGHEAVVTGKIEFVGGGFTSPNSFRFGIFYSDSAGRILETPTDSTRWTGSDGGHSGYLFIPPHGTNDQINWGAASQHGTCGAVVNNTWYNTNGVGNYVLSDAAQLPANALSTAGKYNFSIVVAALSTGVNEVTFSLMKENFTYCFNGFFTDNHVPLVTNKFNCIAFALDSGNTTTSLILYDVLVDYRTHTVGIDEDLKDVKPAIFKLSQNYPNPFNPTTQIKYSIPYNRYVTLKVYNLLGQEVATLFEGVRQPGNYEATFDGSKLTSGVYFYRLDAGNFLETKKLVLIK